MESMDLNELANVMQLVREEEHRVQEGICIVVHPSDEAEVRTGLINAGYDKINVVAHVSVDRNSCVILNQRDLEHVSYKRPKHLWERLIATFT